MRQAAFLVQDKVAAIDLNLGKLTKFFVSFRVRVY